MKKIFLLGAVVLFVGVFSAQAQHVRGRLAFPVNITVRAPGPAPFAGAIWIGPEWVWRGGRYVVVPGYWAKPRKEVWIPGHWVRERGRTYRWMPGYWR